MLRTYTIITIAANATMAELHDRMPVILEAEAWPTWLGEDGGDIPALMRLAGDHVLRLWPVSRAVNSVRRRRLSRAGSVAAYKKGRAGSHRAVEQECPTGQTGQAQAAHVLRTSCWVFAARIGPVTSVLVLFTDLSYHDEHAR